MGVSPGEAEERIEEVCAWFRTEYRREGPFPIYDLDEATGERLSRRDLLADLGDYLPLLWACGEEEEVGRQMRAAADFFQSGGWLRSHQRRRGGLWLPPHEDSFDLTDLLLGAIQLHELRGVDEDRQLIELLLERVRRRFFAKGFVCNWYFPHLRYRFPGAESVSGMFIELLVDLYRLTGEAPYLRWAEEMAAAWLDVPLFREVGLFPTLHLLSSWWRRVGRLRAYERRVNLTKHNVALANGLLALHLATGDGRYGRALERWVGSFRSLLYEKGQGAWHFADLGVNPPARWGMTLLNVAVIDLLCDLAGHGVTDSHLPLARTIADFWLGQQASTGLVPFEPAGLHAHFDSQTDFAVSLLRLHELTGEERYREGAARIVAGQLCHHRGRRGYVRWVDVATGSPRDRTVEVKFVALFLKALLLFRSEAAIYGEGGLHPLLRDR